MKKLMLLGSVAAVLTAAAPFTNAETIFGLTTANSIFSFDSATPGTTSSLTAITGVTTGSIVDIDFSPVNFLLYGIASNGDLYSISTSTGAATLSIGVGSQIAPNTITAPTAIDFNPAADRLRVFQGTSNFRITPDATAADGGATAPGTVSTDGTFTGVAGANLVAAAYTNNSNNNPSGTTLYSLDTTANQLIIHSGAPQFSTIANAPGTGGLGVDIGTTNVGFDISFLQGATSGYVSNGDDFYTINITTGALTSVGVIGNGAETTTSIAAQAVPEPTTTVLAAFGVLGFLARRRRTA